MAKAELTLLLGIIGFCSAVDIELSKEGPCLNPRPKSDTAGIEMFQDKTISWYTPLISKYELYRLAKSLTGKNFEDITDKDLKTSCILFQVESESSSFSSGLGGKTFYDLIPGDSNSFLWKHRGDEDWVGESWITKAGKDYAVGVTCWSSGQRSFAVSSRTKTLNPSLKAEILEHLKSLGFSSKYIYETNYDEGCEDSDSNKNIRDENDL